MFFIGSVFSYSNKNSNPPLRDPFMELDATQQLEESFTQLLTETIVDKFKTKMKNGKLKFANKQTN